MDTSVERELLDRLDKIGSDLALLVKQRVVKAFYTTEEVAVILGKSPFTIREWARLGRCHARKRLSGRGASPAWVISHEELLRLEREGLLPVRGGRAATQGP